MPGGGASSRAASRTIGCGSSRRYRESQDHRIRSIPSRRESKRVRQRSPELIEESVNEGAERGRRGEREKGRAGAGEKGRRIFHFPFFIFLFSIFYFLFAI